MSQRLEPGPDHPITITQEGRRVRIIAGDRTIASTMHALTLKEASYPPVFYIPREDVAMALLEPSDHASHCPYKGDAGYFTIDADGDRRENAVWTYEQPHPAVAAIADYLAFYPDRVDAIEVD